MVYRRLETIHLYNKQTILISLTHFITDDMKKHRNVFNVFNVFEFHIKTSHLICIANEMIAFYMECNTGLKLVNLQSNIYDKLFLEI